VTKLLVALIFAGVVWADDLRAQFDRLKAEGRAALQAEDYAKAETSYRKLMELAVAVHPGTYEMYAEVVSPLAEVYKKTEDVEKLEDLYQNRMDHSGAGLDRGLAQADLGFFYQASGFASADRFRGERLVDEAVKTFEHCSASKTEGGQCRRRLADTAGIQGAMFFQELDYSRAEPLFRRVITMPENTVQDEVMLVSLHALRGIMIVRKQFEEAKQLELRAAAFEAAHPNALSRLKQDNTRSRSR
jgi:tetratricopeptide (TPR) repeat protein